MQLQTWLYINCLDIDHLDGNSLWTLNVLKAFIILGHAHQKCQSIINQSSLQVNAFSKCCIQPKLCIERSAYPSVLFPLVFEYMAALSRSSLNSYAKQADSP